MGRKVKLLRENMVKLAEDALLITVGIQNDGATYQLSPTTRRRVEENFPGLQLLRSVFLGHRKVARAPLRTNCWPRSAV